MPSDSLKDRTVLITGASRGIGYAAGIACARRGATVIAVARTVSGLEKLDDQITDLGGKAVLIPADLSSEDVITRLPGALDQRFSALHGLVLNAGLLGPMMPVADIPGKDWHGTFTLNVHAPLALLKMLTPLLANAGNARVVGIGSRAALVHKPFWGAYAASKAAFESLVRTYGAEQNGTGIAANILDPGPTATDMRAEAMPGEDPLTITQPEAIGERIADMLEPGFDQNAERIAYPRPEGV
jgi:NAD(P)-dependent dehydrogenase (short-subunit alcohol dehydrogenase family)